MDGDGSIQVNHWRKKYLQYRLIIKLSNLKSNEKMLKLISKYIGGKVYYEKKNKEIIKVKWISVSTKDVENCLKILSKYPLLTTNKICQLEHLIQCIENND